MPSLWRLVRRQLFGGRSEEWRWRTGAEVRIDEGATQGDSSDKEPSMEQRYGSMREAGVLCVDIETKAVRGDGGQIENSPR